MTVAGCYPRLKSYAGDYQRDREQQGNSKHRGGVVDGYLKLGLRCIAFAVVATTAVGCGVGSQTVSVDPSNEGFRALNAGDYAKARDVFVPLQAKSPHDPLLELNLGVAYQNLGRMDLAEPLYRGVLVDGKSIVPGVTTNSADSGQTLADIACKNLKLGLKDPKAC
jgi:hypothetical protein